MIVEPTGQRRKSFSTIREAQVMTKLFLTLTKMIV